MPSIMGLDLETYSSAPLPRCGVYRYCDAPDFEILLFSYAFDDEPIQTIDLASGDVLPQEVISALEDPSIIKVAYNAQFERVCLSRYLGHWLDPHQWRCTMVMAAYLTLPGRLADAAVALGATEKKMEEGRELIRYFSVPCKPTKTNGGRTRNLPTDAPEKWAVYRQYNAQDVETERAIRKALEKYPPPEQEWELYALDQQINDRGVRVDKKLVKNAIAVDAVFAQAACQRAKELTGLENPGSVNQLKAWLADQDMPMESLAKKIVQEKAAQTDGIVAELLNLRLELSKTSVKKYEAMARCVCRDGRVHGLLQFYGANRTGRWCLTGDHEVLTDKGWLRLDEWHGGRIACWNASSEAVSFQKAEQVSFDYAGPMYTYRGPRIDQCSTPDHRMRVQPRYGDPWTDMTVKEMSLRRPCIPFAGYRYHCGCANPSWLRVLIMTQADGHYTADGAIRFHFVKQRKIERCKMLLRKAEIPFVVRQHKERALTIEIPARAVPLWLREFRSKTFGFWLLDENPDIFFDELPHWDGYYSAPNSIQYSTVNKQNADIVQALAHMSGRSCIMKSRKKEGANVNYVLDIWLSPGTCHELKGKPVVEEFVGKIYCAVTSTGYFLVRRNGKVWVTGNSGRLVQAQNLPQNHLPDLDLAREIVKTGDEELLDTLFASVPGTLSELIRTAFIPKDGCRFLVADFSAIEARVLAWLANEEWVLEEFRGKGKIYEATASRMFHIPQESIVKGNPNYEYRQKGKQATLSCIAEGQLVLTDHGLIQIENVKPHHRLWDGENWVSHEGVVYRGQREVLTYDGLTATADHLVWIEGQARPVYFGFAAASGARLIRTEYCGHAIRMGEDNQPGKTVERAMESVLRTDGMRFLPQYSMDVSFQSDSGNIQRVSKLLSEAQADSNVAGAAADRCKRALRKPQRQAVSFIWWPRHQILLSVRHSGGDLDSEKCSECTAGVRDGSHRQQRSLCAGKHPICSQRKESGQPARDGIIGMGSGILALFSKCGHQDAVFRENTGRNHRISAGGGAHEAKELEAHRRTARLYDIRNAGPHHRFTVSGRLVHNCGYGGGVGALKAMGAKMPEEEMQPLVDAWRAANPNIVAFWGVLDRAARTVIRKKTSVRVGKVTLYWQDDKMFMRLPSGRNLCYQSPHFTVNRFGSDAIGYYAPSASGQMVVQETFGGKLAENATQAIARDILANALMTLEAHGYPVVFHIHDEAVIEMPIGQGSLEEACRLMAIAPDWAEGLPLRADGEDDLSFYRKT